MTTPRDGHDNDQRQDELDRAAARQHSQAVCRGAYAHAIVREKVEAAFLAGTRWERRQRTIAGGDDAP